MDEAQAHGVKEHRRANTHESLSLGYLSYFRYSISLASLQILRIAYRSRVTLTKKKFIKVCYNYTKIWIVHF